MYASGISWKRLSFFPPLDSSCERWSSAKDVLLGSASLPSPWRRPSAVKGGTLRVQAHLRHHLHLHLHRTKSGALLGLQCEAGGGIQGIHQHITLLVTPTLPITKEPGNPLSRCQLFRAAKILGLIRHLPRHRIRYRPRQDCFETFRGKGGEHRIATLIQEDHLYRSL
jgi:hypothetical protein